MHVLAATQPGPAHAAAVEAVGERAPNSPPKTDTGRLAGSIFADFREDGLHVDVGSDVAYATHLEFGTKNMAARPWLQPAFERNKDKIRARVIKAARAANRKAGRK